MSKRKDEIMAINDKIKIFDVDKNLNIFNLKTKQNDTTGARSFTFKLVKNNKIFDLTGLNIKVGGKKPDGKDILVDCKIIDASKGIIELELTTQMQVVSGFLNLELIFFKGGIRLSSIPFEIEVLESATDLKGIISSNEFESLNNAIDITEEYANKLKEGTEKIELQYAEILNGLGSQLSQKLTISNILNFLKENHNSIIDLYGDSITAGVGASGHSTPSTGLVLYDYDGEKYYEGDHNCKCWANLLRNYLKEKYPSITYTNRGIGGKSARWFNGNRERLVKTGDIAFIQLGTNDRWDNTLEGFRTDLSEFIDYVSTRYKLIILMSATPAMTDNDESMHFDSFEMDSIISQLAEEKQIFHISNLKDIFIYSNLKGIAYTEMLQRADQGSHPWDNGHYFIFRNILEKLKLPLVDTYSNRLQMDSVDKNTSVDYFKEGVSSCLTTSKSGLPGGNGGVLITHKYADTEDIRNSFQLFYPKLTAKTFKRILLGDKTWSDWIPCGSFILENAFKIDINSLPWGIYYDLVLDRDASLFNSPTNAGGILITYKLDDNIDFSKQEFRPYNTRDVWIRSNSNNNWTPWERQITGRVTTKTIDFGTINANQLKSIEISHDYNFDTNYFATSVTHTGDINAKLLFGYTFVNGNRRCFIQLFNTSNETVTVGSIKVDIIETKK